MDYSLVLCVVQIILLFLVLFPLATHKCSIIEKKMLDKDTEAALQKAIKDFKDTFDPGAR